MADLRRSVRDLFLQGVEAVNNAANHVATATRSKVDELNLRNRRKEVLDSLANTLYVYWMQGLELPEALTEKLRELQGIDEQLAAFERQVEKAESAQESEEETVPSMEGEEAEVEAEPVDEPVAQEVPTLNVQEPEETDQEE